MDRDHSSGHNPKSDATARESKHVIAESTDLPAKLETILAKLQDPTSNKKKDGWDKATTIAQIFSGTIIAVLTVVVAWYAHAKDISEKTAELAITTAHADAESDLEEKKYFMEFLDQLDKGEPRAQDRLLDQMEYLLPPEQAVRVAMGDLHPPFAMENKDQYAMDSLRFNHLTLYAKHIAQNKPVADFLREVSQSDVIPDREIARALLGEKTNVYFRASEIDDFGDVTLNGVPLIDQLTFGGDSGWIRISDKLLKVGGGNSPTESNKLVFLITNGPAGGFGGRFQVSAGLQQYDTGPYTNPGCPCNKPALKFTIDLRLHPNREVELQPEVPETPK
jgi:hypothetical protein